MNQRRRRCGDRRARQLLSRVRALRKEKSRRVNRQPVKTKPKAGRHKRRVVKKQDVLELREKELRGGRIPKKKRVLPGKEVRKTEITDSQGE